MGIKVQYKSIGNFEFAQVITKLANTVTQINKAQAIRDVVKAVNELKTKMAAAYHSDVLAKFAETNEDGSYKRPTDDDKGFVLKEGSEPDMNKANEAFGETEAILTVTETSKEKNENGDFEETLREVSPLSLSTLSDVKLSAKELELLKDLVADQEGPGVPMMGGQQFNNLRSLQN